MAGFGRQVAALLKKDFRVAKASPKATVCELICPLMMGIIAGLFIFLVGLIQNLFGTEYKDIIRLDQPNGTFYASPAGNATSPNPLGNMVGDLISASMTNDTTTSGYTYDVLKGYENISYVQLENYTTLAQTANTEMLLPPFHVRQAVGFNIPDLRYPRNLSVHSNSNVAFVESKDYFRLMLRFVTLFYEPEFTAQLVKDYPDTYGEQKFGQSYVKKTAGYKPVYFLMNFRAVFASSGMGFLLLGFIPSLILTAGRLVDEKNNKVRESLKVMGTGDGAYLMSNFISSFIRIGTGTILIGFALAAWQAIPPIGIPQFMGYGALYALSLIAFAQIMPSLFSQSLWSNVCCILFIWGGSTLSSLATGFPTVLQIICCLWSPVAYYFATLPILSEGTMQLTFSQQSATIMLVVDLFLYIIIGNYIYAVNPGTYGVPKHPLFFLGFGKSKPTAPKGSVDSRDEALTDAEQLNSPGKTNRVVVKNLVKFYGSNVDNPAVNGLNLGIQSGEIFALLGHNGAGKTTTMSILTGMVTASHYQEASVDRLDITKDIDAIRQTVGLCPQFDVLFGDLTARQHLELFAAIKGREDDTDRIDYLLNELELLDESKPADKFSGGMKRRLSVGNALVGGATLIFLDEPSSGMDPLNRRRMWNLLRKERDLGKTLVLTTHFMEEADFLGDRIAIMSHGKMYCCDTSQRLKEKYGVGFYLTLVKPPEDPASAQVDAALSLVKKFVPECEKHHESSGDVTFMLPTSALHLFGNMLSDLEKELPALNFHSYGVSMNTLEDVFVSISQAEENKDANGKKKVPASRKTIEPISENEDLDEENDPVIKAVRKSNPLGNGSNTATTSSCSGGKQEETAAVDVPAATAQAIPPELAALFEQAQSVSHGERVKNQAKHIFWRKCGLLLRSGKMKLMVLFLPVLFISLAYLTMQPQAKANVVDIRGSNTIDFDDDITLFWIDMREEGQTALVRNKMSELYHQTYGHNIKWLMCSDYSCYTSGRFIPVHTLNFITGIKQPPYPAGFLIHNIDLFNKTSPNMFYSFYYFTQYRPYESMVLANLFNAAVELAFNPNNTDVLLSLQSFNGFNEKEGNAKYTGISFETGDTQYNFMLTGVYTIVALCLLLANCVIPVTDEIQRGVFHTLRVHGMTVSAYYIGNLSFDFICMLYPWIIFTIGMYIKGVTQFDSSIMLLVILSALLMNIHILCHAYILANAKQLKPVMYTAALIGIVGIQTAGPYMASLTLENISPIKTFADHFKPWLLSLTPSCAWYRLLDYASAQSSGSSPSVVNFNRDQGMSALTFIFQIVELVVPFYIMWGIITERGTYRPLKKEKDSKAATATSQNTSAAGQSTPLLDAPQRPEDEAAEVEAKDADVVAEEERVLKGDGSDMISVKKLLKCFGHTGSVSVAVDEVSYGLKKGECFGLLGPNGAGKTTSCKCILREHPVDGGDIDFSYTSWDKSATNDEKFLKSKLGLCSQSDTLWEHMTADEHMDHYLAMRLTTLYKKEQWQKYIDETIDKVQLEGVGTKHAGGFSGGMKRKLAVAIAMYTGANAVFLDEPSTGMDPFARRALWTVILEALASDRSVLLTTHSMEEADAVCARIAIMTTGQMRCIGSSQHLKNRFGSGYVVTLSLDDEKVKEEEEMENIDEKVIAHFGGKGKAELSEALGTQRKYSIGTIPSLAAAFSQIETKREDWCLKQYSIAQTSSLEQIFLKFVGRDDSQNDT